MKAFKNVKNAKLIALARNTNLTTKDSVFKRFYCSNYSVTYVIDKIKLQKN